MSTDTIRRAVADLPFAARRDVVSRIGSDLALVERVIDQAAWLSFRLRAAWSKR